MIARLAFDRFRNQAQVKMDKKPDRSSSPELRILEYGNLVYGVVGLIVLFVSYWTTKFEVILGFMAGAGWILVTALLGIIQMLRRTISKLEAQADLRETEIADVRASLAEWRGVAQNDSTTLKRFVEKAFPVEQMDSRGVVKRRKP